MTDGNIDSGTKAINYASNSNKAKQPEKAPDNATLAPVVQNKAVERKEPLSKKFFSAYANDSVGSVGSYLLMEVIVPATKNLISDLVTQGINRMLYGRSTPSGGGGQGNRQPSYSRFFGGGSGQAPSSVGSQTSSYNNQARTVQNTSQIVFATRADAEMTLDSLREYIDRYGSVKLVNLYQAAGVSTNFTDQKYGWTDLSRASVQQIREGYIIDLPKTEVLP